MVLCFVSDRCDFNFFLGGGGKARTRPNCWAEQRELETTSAPSKRLVQAPNRKTLRLYEGLTKPQCAVLIQMRTMRIGLRHFLFKIKATESDRCSCDEGSQTPKHVVMQCPHYTKLRAKLWAQIAKYDVETDYNKIVSHPQATRYVANLCTEQVSFNSSSMWGSTTMTMMNR